LIYPIAKERWLVKLPAPSGKSVIRRKSPKLGRYELLFRELVSCAHLLNNPNFSLEALLIIEEEARCYDPTRCWRRRGWVTQERRLISVVERRLFEQPADWLSFIPQGLDSFTATSLAESLRINQRLAQQMAYCLRKAQFIDLQGKRGRANLYRVNRARC
jgi:hypothetical protein